MPRPTKSNLTALLALAIAALVSTGAQTFGQGPSDAPPKPRPANPLNPLAAIDPFIGTFDGEGMTILIRKGGEGYEGEVRRGDQIFPLKGARKGDLLAGAFEHEGEKFEFFMMVTADGVSFNTPLKLKRREAAGAAPVKPTAMPEPSPTPTPATPGSLTPSATPTIKDTTIPKPPAVTPPAAGATPKQAPFNFKADDGFSWAGLPKGSFVRYEDTNTEPGALPLTAHSLLWFTGLEGGKEVVQPYLLIGEKWRSGGQPITWLAKTNPLDKLGYKAGAQSTGNLLVDGADLPCDITEYSREIQRNGKNVTLRLQLWTSPRIMLPAQVVTFDGDSIALPANFARMVTLGDEWETKGEFKLVSLKQTQRIGAVELKVAVFEGLDNVTTATLALETHTTRHVSSQVPGGIALLSVHKRNQLNQVHTLSTTAVGYGLAPTEAELPVP